MIRVEVAPVKIVVVVVRYSHFDLLPVGTARCAVRAAASGATEERNRSLTWFLPPAERGRDIPAGCPYQKMHKVGAPPKRESPRGRAQTLYSRPKSRFHGAHVIGLTNSTGVGPHERHHQALWQRDSFAGCELGNPRGRSARFWPGKTAPGKSTLIKILAGVHTEYEGTIEIEGRAVRPRSPLEARRLGRGRHLPGAVAGAIR